MFDVYIEIIRALLTGCIVWFLYSKGKKNQLNRYPGWRFIFSGFCLLFFASTLDITDNVDSLAKYIIIGDTTPQAILEKLFGYLLSSVFILIGFIKFIPVFSELDRTKNDLKKELTKCSKIEKNLAESLRQVETEKTFVDAIINSLPGIFTVSTEDMKIIQWNKAYEEKIGFSPSTSARNILHPVAEEDITRISKRIRQSFHHGESSTTEVKLKTVTGELIPYLLTGTLLRTENEKFLISIGIDISEQKILESRLRQAQKMESIGTLAGGIAHDFNNILAAIFGYNELARMQVDPKSNIAENLLQVEKASVRARDLVKQILTFSHKHALEKKPLQMSLIVKEALKLLQSSLPATIEINANIAARSMIMADPSQIHQLTMNLCTNAYHAMQAKGGILSIELSEITIGKTSEINLDIPAGQYLKLEIHDTGCGMEDEIKNQIFEPYFTTKGVDKGTGLGLSVVHGIVKNHNGAITVQSKVGQGTFFSIYLPIISEGVAEEGLQPSGVPLTGNNEQIMVVDDEKEILDLAEQFLTGAGFNVTVFNDAEQAMEAFYATPEKWAVIITDQTMPKMTGVQFIEQITKLHPNQPIILSSGYSEAIDEKKAKELGASLYMQKPFNKDDLLGNVHMLLKITE